MKAIYLKPTTEDLSLFSGSIMITASGSGKPILEDGGSTNEVITEGDSRLHNTVWDDEELYEEF